MKKLGLMVLTALLSITLYSVSAADYSKTVSDKHNTSIGTVTITCKMTFHTTGNVRWGETWDAKVQNMKARTTSHKLRKATSSYIKTTGTATVTNYDYQSVTVKQNYTFTYNSSTHKITYTRE